MQSVNFLNNYFFPLVSWLEKNFQENRIFLVEISILSLSLL